MLAPEPALWTDDFLRGIRPEVFATGLHKAEPHWVSTPRGQVQKDYDIWYVAVGGGEVRVNGEWHAFQAGDLITIKPGDVYQRERADPADPFQVYFTHLLPFGRENSSLDEALAQVWPLKISMLHQPELAVLFERLFEAYTTRRSAQSLAVRGLALLLLDMIFDELRGAPVESPPRAWQCLLQTREFMEAHYARDLSLAEIARHSGISASHLSALFKCHVGCPPVEYLLRVRLREAKLLLAQGERVKEVAHATGFRSQQYFSRAFKKKTGMPPTQFAAMHARTPGSKI
ncbi:MAG: helix-turn-helix transcriptional regulator [Lentisphaeria bacterium]|nr:helix-turn-helix transcriptional regulator [Lentisphaeria bacterium]